MYMAIEIYYSVAIVYMAIENTSESDSHSYEATGAVALRKPRKDSVRGFNNFINT